MTISKSTTNGDVPGSDLRSLIREVSREAKKSKTPIFIAVLAAFLALVAMADGDADKRAMVAHIESANQFAYFQAKNIRKTDSEIAAGLFESMGQPVLASKWQAKADKYKQEKVEILNAARDEQAKRAIAGRQGDYFSVAIAMLQIAIVLASVSLLLRGGILLAVSIVLALIAVLFSANGYGLYWEIPTDPVILAKWLATNVGSGEF